MTTSQKRIALEKGKKCDAQSPFLNVNSSSLQVEAILRVQKTKDVEMEGKKRERTKKGAASQFAT